MRVIVPFTKLQPATEAALLASRYVFELYNVAGDDEALHRLWAWQWQAPGDICQVEHDVQLEQNTLFELDTCTEGEGWCQVPVEYFNGPYPGMGCVRFTLSFRQRYPFAIEQTAYMVDSHPPRHWCRLDGRLQSVLRAAGAVPHVHGGVLRHVRLDGVLRPSHGCVEV